MIFSIERKLLDEIRLDCYRWRRLVSQCAQRKSIVLPSIEEQYKVVHVRILAKCRDLAARAGVPESRQHTARQLDELLRPWSSPQALQEASPSLVCDLLKSQASLEEQLKKGNGERAVGGRNVVVIASLAAVGGFFVVALMPWLSEETAPLFDALNGILSTIAAYVQQSTFTEQFAIAVLCTWLFGTWLLSRLSSN